MKYRYFMFVALLFSPIYASATLPPAPVIAVKPQAIAFPHGTINDDYAWIDSAGAQLPALIAQENDYSSQFLASETALQQQLGEEMRQRAQRQNLPLEWQDNGYWYRQTYSAQGRYPLFERRSVANNSSDQPWQTVIDAAARAKPYAYYQLNLPLISPDNRSALLIEDRQGDEVYHYALLDLQSQTIRELDFIAQGDAVWSQDSQTFYALQHDPLQQITGLVRYDVASNRSTRLYQPTDPHAYLALAQSSSKRYLLLSEYVQDRLHHYLLDLHAPTALFQAFTPENSASETYLDHSHNGFYLRSNRDNPNFELFYAATPSAEWQPIYQPQADETVESFVILHNWEIVKTRYLGVPKLRYRAKDSTQSMREIPFPDGNYTLSLLQGDGTQADSLSLFYTAFNTPKSAVKFDLAQHKWLNEFPLSAQAYHSEYRFATARDGTRIPISLMYKKSLFQPHQSSLLLTAYGAYGFSMQPVFGTGYRSLLDRGFVYAVAHIRGGGELGIDWHAQGRGLQKQNSINDVIDSTLWLQQNGYAAANRTYAMAESAGAIAVAAAVNQQPQLYRAAVLQVPFLDMLTALSSPAVSSNDIAEWGDLKRADAFQAITDYSPYQQLKAQPYPAFLLIAAAQDKRTPLVESLKFIAKLRRYNLSHAPALLSVEQHSGHAGEGRFARLQRNRLAYAFLLKIDRAAMVETPLKPNNQALDNQTIDNQKK